MSEKDEPTPEEPVESSEVETPAAETPARRRFRDRLAGTGERLRGTRGLIAATLAALIVGGFGGAAIHAAVDGDDHDRHRFRGEWPGEMRGDFGDRFGERFDGDRPGPPDGFFREAPRGVPGQLPPTPTPSESSSS